MGNSLPRNTVKVYEFNGRYRVTLPRWAVAKLGVKGGDILEVTDCRKGQWVKAETNGILYEVVE